MSKIFFFLILLSCFITACTHPIRDNQNDPLSIEFVDKITISNSELIDSTKVGGLSSIDFIEDNKFVLISDDRSEYSPARFYEITIEFDSNRIIDYAFDKTIFLLNKENLKFQENEMDPESIRYRKSTNTYFYSSEGGRAETWVNPYIWEVNREGAFVANVEVPSLFHFNDKTGLRENGGFESLTFENDTIIWYANELPLKEDGDVAGFESGKFPIRLVRQDIKNNIVLGQYAYNISPLDQKPNPEDGFYINSVSEILFVKENIIWVLERSYTTGVGNFVRIFEIEYENATDIKNLKGLTNTSYNPVSKKLLLDFSDYSRRIDNIEGLAFGPDFSNGRKSLFFISDDNFNEQQETQLWLFSVKGID